MDILSIENVSKRFRDRQIIDKLNLNVPENCIYGFIGQNGAGKTTTMKMILGLIKADEGTIKVCGEKVKFGQTPTNKYIGYLPDVPEFYNYMTPLEYLRLCGSITGISRKEIEVRSEQLIELTGLEKHDKKIAGFSRGMKQRLGIAQALINKPELLICDEPTSALDPLGRKELLDILERVKGETTVIFSTHILSDVERICDRIGVLNKGRLEMTGTLSEIKAHKKCDRFVIQFATAEDMKQFESLSIYRKEFKNVEKQENYTMVVTTADVRNKLSVAMKNLAEHNIIPNKLEVMEPSLENLFMEVIA